MDNKPFIIDSKINPIGSSVVFRQSALAGAMASVAIVCPVLATICVELHIGQLLTGILLGSYAIITVSVGLMWLWILLSMIMVHIQSTSYGLGFSGFVFWATWMFCVMFLLTAAAVPELFWFTMYFRQKREQGIGFIDAVGDFIANEVPNFVPKKFPGQVKVASS